MIIAARKWSHLESSKRREASLARGDPNRSPAALERSRKIKLAAIVDERDEAKRDFESWKETMEKDAAKRDKLAEEKLEGGVCRNGWEVRQELALAKRKLEEVGLTKEELAKARELNTELQRQLGEASEANMAELEKLHDELDKSKEDAARQLEEALRATEALRAELADAQRESREFKKDLDSTRADLDATKARLDEANERLKRSRDAAAQAPDSWRRPRLSEEARRDGGRARGVGGVEGGARRVGGADQVQLPRHGGGASRGEGGARGGARRP